MAARLPPGRRRGNWARELGVDLSRVTGTGPSGRISQEDIKTFVQQTLASPSSGAPGVRVPPLPDFSKWGEIEKRPLDSVRRKTAEQMSLAWTLIPHVTHNDLADITELDAFRKVNEGKGSKLTVTAFALKAVSIALQRISTVQREPRLRRRTTHSQAATIMSASPSIPNAGCWCRCCAMLTRRTFAALAQELTDVAEKTRQKKIQPDDLRGGTFTITNLGSIGGTGFTPIVNYPEVAILGMSRGRLQPVILGGQVVPRLLLPLSLSYDHRVIDGAAAARFVRRIVDMLENPMVMVLDG